MVAADPLGGNTPYEVLGADETETLEAIEEKYERVFVEYRDQKRKARQKNDNEAFKRSSNAIKEISKAWEWIENNHEPPAADEPITVEVRTDDPRVGEPIALKVTGDSGPVETPVWVSRDGTEISSEKTEPDGTVAFTVRSHGPVQFTAATTDPYEDATEVVTVERKRVDLSFESPPTTAEVGESVTFTVLADGSRESDVVLEASSTALGTTGPDGGFTHAFEHTGGRTVTARKPDDDAATYDGCATDIEVTPETVDVDVAVEGSDHEIGDTVTVHVTEGASGRPIEDAEVAIGTESDTTDGSGETQLSLPETGEVTVTATKSVTDDDRNYGEGRERIPVSKRQRSLTIESIDGKRMENAALTVTVIDDRGDPVEDATVVTNWGHDERTDAEGTATIGLDDDGSLKIEARKESEDVAFDSATSVEQIDEFTRELEIESAPDLAEPDTGIEIVVTDNAGQPVPGAEVTCDKQIGKTWTTDRDGAVRIPLLDQVGNRRITIKKDDGDFDAAVETNVRVL